MKPLALGFAALALLTLLVPAASATPRVDPVLCYVVAVGDQPGLVYDLLRLAVGTTTQGCVIGVGGANFGLDTADSACGFLLGRPCLTP